MNLRLSKSSHMRLIIPVIICMAIALCCTGIVTAQSLGVRSLDSLTKHAEVYEKEGQYQKALEVVLHEYSETRRILGDTTFRSARVLMRLGNLYEALGDDSMAAVHLHRSLNIHEALYEPTSVKLSIVLMSLGRYYERQGRYHDARTYYERDLLICERHWSDDPVILAYAHTHVASVYAAIDSNSLAEAHYQNAISILLGSGKSHESVLADILIKYASVKNDLADMETAIALQKTALELISKRNGPNTIEYLDALSGYSKILSDAGRNVEALEIQQQVVESATRFESVDSKSYLRKLSGLAHRYKDLGNYSQALQIVRQIRNTIRNDEHPGHDDYADIMVDIVELCVLLDDDTLTVELARSTASRMRQINGPRHAKTARAYCYLGAAYLYAGDYENARVVIDSSLTMLDVVYGNEHPMYAAALSYSAMVSEAKRNYARAEIDYRKSITLLRKVSHFDENHLRSVETRLLNMLSMTGQRAKYIELEAEIMSTRK